MNFSLLYLEIFAVLIFSVKNIFFGPKPIMAKDNTSFIQKNFKRFLDPFCTPENILDTDFLVAGNPAFR
jgi:hypothetical protein